MTAMAVNVGSSSVKTSLFVGLSRIDINLNFFGLRRQKLSISCNGVKESCDCLTPTMADAANLVADTLALKVIEQDLADVGIVGHRVKFVGVGPRVQLFDEVIMDSLQTNSFFSSRHNEFCLTVFGAIKQRFPNAVQLAVRDFSVEYNPATNYDSIPFSLPQIAKYSMIPLGYHGLALAAAMRFYQKHISDLASKTVLFLQIGSGVSVTKCQDGKVETNTMKFAACDGPRMHNRSGDIPPGAILRALKSGLALGRLSDFLNLESGIYGLANADPEASLSVEEILTTSKYCKAKKAYMSFLTRCALSAVDPSGPLDGIVFSGGLGWKHPFICDEIATKLVPTTGPIDWQPEENNAQVSKVGDTNLLRLDIDEQLEIFALVTEYQQTEQIVPAITTNQLGVLQAGTLFGQLVRSPPCEESKVPFILLMSHDSIDWLNAERSDVSGIILTGSLPTLSLRIKTAYLSKPIICSMQDVPTAMIGRDIFVETANGPVKLLEY